ncbi:hypothetical protein BN940_17881 [Castellaniella defragrans 65Phen]|uniref:Uncharacterized protein n=1 Tax=Castellaniella defragrans (strain DSM 12143 / CCUG 39792 / 65Phen) TaxID=1437824 RepID=W8X5X4_CASD6|nr:hypothetical protein BN940_17881 [Castellaniella defragrans 65Phen]
MRIGVQDVAPGTKKDSEMEPSRGGGKRVPEGRVPEIDGWNR